MTELDLVENSKKLDRIKNIEREIKHLKSFEKILLQTSSLLLLEYIDESGYEDQRHIPEGLQVDVKAYIAAVIENRLEELDEELKSLGL